MRSSPRGLLVRNFIPDDAQALLAVHQRAITATPDRFYTRQQRMSWAASLTPEGYLEAVKDGEVFEVAMVGEEVVAFCSRKGGSVQGLYVDPTHQRRGIGHTLLARAEAALRREGVNHTEVRASLPAVGFYEKAGYAIVDAETHTTRGGLPLPIKVMSKRLG